MIDLFNRLSQEFLIDTPEESLISLTNSDIDWTIFKDANTIAFEKVAPKNQLIFIRKHTRYIHYPKHSHDYIEINYVLNGSSTQIVEGSKVSLTTGDLLLMTPGTKHEILPTSREDLIVNFLIHPKFFDYIFKFIQVSSSLSSFFSDAVYRTFSQRALIYSTKRHNNLQLLIKNILDELNGQSSLQNGKIKLYLGLLIMELIPLKPIELTSSTFEQKTILKVIMYIENNLQHASLKEISTQLGFKDYNLSKLIKKETSSTFREILKDFRLKRISSLLLTSNLTIGDLALQCGFSNSSYFYREFKSSFGISPKEFKKNHLDLTTT